MIKTLGQLDSRSPMGKVLRVPLRLIPPTAVVKIKTGLNKGARWKVGSSIHKCWIGTYESDMQSAVAKLVRPGMTVWDVGANAGFYTLAFSRLVGAQGRVFAFEPFAENADNILSHVRLNNLRNAVLVQAALGPTSGLTGFKTAELNAKGRISKDETSYLVPVFTVDDFVVQHPTSRPDLLKIDVEGAESSLLNGARSFLRESLPIVVLALHGRDQCEKCAELLSGIGYALYYLDGNSISGVPADRVEIVALPGTMPNPLTTNA